MTKVEIKERSGCTKKLHIEIEQERVDSEFTGTLKKIKKDIQLPGFRKGRAPEGLVLKRFGSMIREEAIKELIPKVLEEVWKSEGFKPVGEPMISDVNIDKDNPITLTVAIEEIPEIDSSVFSNITAVKKVFEISDDDVEDAVQRYRHMRAKQTEVDRGAQQGDILVVNLQQLDTAGVPIIGEKMENEVIDLNSEGPLSEDIIKQFEGMKAGDRRNVRFTSTVDEYAAEKPDRPELYDVEMIKVMENVIPELNDELFAEIGTYTDLADFREKTREQLEYRANTMANTALNTNLIDEFVKQAPFEVPDSMVRRILASELENRKRSMPDQPVDEESFLRDFRPDAVRIVQSYLIIEAVEEQNGIEVSRDEISGHINKLAEENGMNPKELRRQFIKDGSYENIRTSLARNKAYDWMSEQADITIETIDRNKEDSNIIVPNRS